MDQGRYLLSYEAGDDHFDWSEGWQGKLQYIIAFQTQRLDPAPGTGTFSSDPRGFEGDGCDPSVSGCVVDNTNFTMSSQPFSNPTIANFSLVGAGNNAAFPQTSGMVIRRGSAGYFINGISSRFGRTGIQCRDAQTGNHLDTGLMEVLNMIFAENTQGNYDDAANTSRFCQQSRFTGDNHREVTTASQLFTSLNPAGLDWTPTNEATSGGGNIDGTRASGFFGGTMDNTSFVGAADPSGPAWWLGWSVYLIN